MDGKTIIKLSADLAAGLITQDWITEKFGDDVLTKVLGFGLGIGAGAITNSLLDRLDEETGLVSDAGDFIDDVLDLF